ncbi:hypothetical protein Taro_050444, partial [Colocasia esculenta]|nr:hypothetical protein [Colocasia esculenta]
MASHKLSLGKRMPLQRSDISPSPPSSSLPFKDFSAVFHPLKDFAAIPCPSWDFYNFSMSGAVSGVPEYFGHLLTSSGFSEAGYLRLGLDRWWVPPVWVWTGGRVPSIESGLKVGCLRLGLDRMWVPLVESRPEVGCLRL